MIFLPIFLSVFSLIVLILGFGAGMQYIATEPRQPQIAVDANRFVLAGVVGLYIGGVWLGSML